MTRVVSGVEEVASDYDAFIFDQWGVMHHGGEAFAGVPEAMAGLRRKGKRIVVLSNSGRRVGYNARRMEQIGYGPDAYDTLVTSGEATWIRLRDGLMPVPGGGYWVLSQDDETTASWKEGLDGGMFAESFDESGGLIFLALPTGTEPEGHRYLLERMGERRMPMVCGNPDMHAPGERGLHPAPGHIARDYERMGGEVEYVGKPHPYVYELAMGHLDGVEADRMLMVGDNISTDVAGASAAGLDSLLVASGVHAKDLSRDGLAEGVGRLARRTGVAAPQLCCWDTVERP